MRLVPYVIPYIICLFEFSYILDTRVYTIHICSCCICRLATLALRDKAIILGKYYCPSVGYVQKSRDQVYLLEQHQKVATSVMQRALNWKGARPSGALTLEYCTDPFDRTAPSSTRMSLPRLYAAFMRKRKKGRFVPCSTHLHPAPPLTPRTRHVPPFQSILHAFPSKVPLLPPGLPLTCQYRYPSSSLSLMVSKIPI